MHIKGGFIRFFHRIPSGCFKISIFPLEKLRTSSFSVGEARCLFHPDLVLKCWRISGEPLVFSSHEKDEEDGSWCQWRKQQQQWKQEGKQKGSDVKPCWQKAKTCPLAILTAGEGCQDLLPLFRVGLPTSLDVIKKILHNNKMEIN